MIRETVASNCSRLMLDSKRDVRSSGRGLDGRHRLAEPLAHLGDRLDGARVGGLDPAVLDEGTGDHGHLVALVVEGDQHVGDHQRHVGQPERVGVRLAERLDRADQVVAEEARRRRRRTAAAHPARRSRSARGSSATAAYGSGASVTRSGAAPEPESGVDSLPHSESRPSLQRRIDRGRKPRNDQRPRRPCSADSSRNAGAVAPQLEEGADRGLEVVDEAVADRDHVGAPRQLTGAIQVRLEAGHDARARVSATRLIARPDRVHRDRLRPFRICSTSAIETPRESSSTARW